NLGTGLATNRVQVRLSFYGDTNLDGKVDMTDIGNIIGMGWHGRGTGIPVGQAWLGGDFNYDGIVDGNDIGLILGAGPFPTLASYGPRSAANAKSASSASTLANSRTISRAPLAQSTTIGVAGDNSLDFIYAINTGDVSIKYDGDPRITANTPLQRLQLLSAAG